MKKILFILRGYYPNDNSSGGNVIKRIIDHLSANTDHRIHIYTLYQNATRNDSKSYDVGSVKVYLHHNPISNGYARVIVNRSGVPITNHMGIEGTNIFQVAEAMHDLRQLCHHNDYDLIISTCFPFEAHYCASKLHAEFDIPWIAYYLDPYTPKSDLRAVPFRKKLKREINTIRSAHTIIALPQMIREYEDAIDTNPDISVPLHFTSLDLPLLTDPSDSPETENEVLTPGYINCVYAGELYEDWRNPEFVLNLFDKLNDERIKLYLIGRRNGFSDDYFPNWSARMGDRLVLCDRMPESDINYIYRKADVLVNVGNSVTNMVPGKLIKLISTGKTILNTYKMKDCPSLDYMTDYPKAINIYEKDPLTEEAINQIRTDIEKAQGSPAVPYQEICRIYHHLDVNFIYGEIERYIDQI
ncbi:MAG: hypothetical protein IJS12_10580 [Lachnospiraceae bacterium]|nr:hypothetical protein [Lachnospiraceae bacterium]